MYSLYKNPIQPPYKPYMNLGLLYEAEINIRAITANPKPYVNLGCLGISKRNLRSSCAEGGFRAEETMTLVSGGFTV